MLALARYTLNSPYHAAATVALVAVLSLLIPMLGLVSGALVALIVLTQGWQQGLRPILAATLALSALTWFWQGSFIMGVSVGLVQWLPLMALALVYRWSRSLSFVLIVALGLAAFLVVIQHLFIADAFDKTAMALLQEILAKNHSEELTAQQQQGLQNTAALMSRAVVPVLMLMWMLALILGRWVDRRLQSQSFAAEYTALKLGRSASATALLVVAVGLFQDHALLQSLQMLALAGLMFQGLALLYLWLQQAGRSSTWFWLYCFLMMLFPFLVGVTALLGGLDNWVSLTRKTNE